MTAIIKVTSGQCIKTIMKSNINGKFIYVDICYIRQCIKLTDQPLPTTIGS